VPAAFACLLLIGLLALEASAVAGTSDPATIVSFKPGAQEKLALPAGASLEPLGPDVALVEGAPPDELEGLAGVARAEPDGIVHAAELDLLTALLNLLPEYNDRLWHIYNFGQDSGRVDADIDWPEAMGLPDVEDPRYAGRRASVATIDSGIDPAHRELDSRLCQRSGEAVVPGQPAAKQPNGVDDDDNGIVDDIWGADFVDEDGIPEDRTGHGTLVAGLIAAEQSVNGDGDGVVGAARTACVSSLRVFGETGTGRWSDVIQALHYAIDQRYAVVNMSVEGSGLDFALERALDRAEAHSVMIVAAAGNSGVDIDKPASGVFPAAYDSPAIVSVTASNRLDQLPPWANRGAQSVDLAAPGLHVRSAKAGGGFASVSGTSFAAPLVAGASSEILRRSAQLGPAGVRRILLDSAEEEGGLASAVQSGGRLNLPRALEAVDLDDRSTRPATRLRTRRSKGNPKRYVFRWRPGEPGATSALVVNERVAARIRPGRRPRAKLRVRRARRASWWIITQDQAGNEVRSAVRRVARRR